MNDSLKKNLKEAFKKHDVLFWYNTDDESYELFDSLELDDVKKLKIEDNEFYIKYVITHKSKDEKFLVYSNQARPENEKNWLLDLELAYQLFHTDEVSLVLQYLDLDFYFRHLVETHLAFFKAKDRLSLLKSLLGERDTEIDIRYKMLAVVFKSDFPNLNHFAIIYGSAFINGNEKLDKDLERFNLKDFFWKQIEKHFGYSADQPTIYDFLIEVFTHSVIFSDKPKVNKEARFLLSLWKDTLSVKDNYDKLSTKISQDLNVESLLSNVELEEIIDEDYFRLEDLRILYELIQRVLSNEISNDKLQAYIKSRENKFWYITYESLYQSVSYASELKFKINEYRYTFKDVFDGIKKYSEVFYEIDYLYRKFIYWYRKSKHDSSLKNLSIEIEKLYVNTWLLSFNNEWQKVVDGLSIWPTQEKFSQRNFYDNYIQSYVEKEQRIFVVISDALRYECGKELTDLILKENGFDAKIKPLLSSLPSYTQLGMASLLPNRSLSLVDGGDSVLVDGKGTIGLNARKSLLEVATDGKAIAISADEYMQIKGGTKGKEFIKPYNVIYIYHNRIDKIGDDKVTEDKLVDAVEEELVYLIDVIKKIRNDNGNNIIITSDHGFLYEYREVDESDFMQLDTNNSDVFKYNRRFVIGKNLPRVNTTVHFTHEQLNLESEGEVLIPKSVNRLRVKGAGSKFVHGGASLQEVVIPLIKINNKRIDTIGLVDIDIIKSSDTITTNLLSISFLQSEMIRDNLLGRHIQAYLVAEDGTILSDIFTYTFDSEDENVRQREVKHRFQLSSLASGKYKNQRVKLILEEPVKGAQKWKVYKEFYFTLNISFASDFDF